MPTYAYACTACEHRFEAQQSFKDASLTECPECSGTLRKLFNSVGIVFKGSGFYRTDSRKDSRSGGGEGAAASGEKAAAKSSDGAGSSSTGSGGSDSGSSGSGASAASSSGSGSSSSSGSGTSTAASGGKASTTSAA